MPTQTDFAHLKLYSATGADTELSFLKFRSDIAGIGSTDEDKSNFQKIDELLSTHNTMLQGSRKIFDITANIQADNTYLATNIQIEQYYDNMLILLCVDTTNIGAVNLGINELTPISIKKYDSEGNLVDLEANDLIANVKYLIEYSEDFNGYQGFIVISPINYYTKAEVDNAIQTAINSITDGDEVDY